MAIRLVVQLNWLLDHGFCSTKKQNSMSYFLFQFIFLSNKRKKTNAFDRPFFNRIRFDLIFHFAFWLLNQSITSKQQWWSSILLHLTRLIRSKILFFHRWCIKCISTNLNWFESNWIVDGNSRITIRSFTFDRWLDLKICLYLWMFFVFLDSIQKLRKLNLIPSLFE